MRDFLEGAQDAFIGLILIAGLIGWFLNLFKILDADGGLLILRVVGVVVPPLGALLGFFP